MSKNNFTIESLDAFYCILKQEVEKFGAGILDVEKIKQENKNFPEIELDSIRRNFLVDFGESGFHLPDFDRVIYDVKNYEAIAIIFSSTNLAWGIAESAYWKMKYDAVRLTKHIKVFFVIKGENFTLENEENLTTIRRFKRELDGCYTLHENAECKVKLDSLNRLIEDVRSWIK
ncbi:MAG: hypothetical protein B6I38_03895 [Anaerolineaceae bacterium 4572_5.1]|nr:MAG: hypothetical protein B6I38_03895 [Anaerolineaceae bacterium 4572_5.1]